VAAVLDRLLAAALDFRCLTFNPMRTLPSLRPRVASEQISGANIRILMGEFGVGSPVGNMSAYVNPDGYPGLYFYHEGDLFTPGAQNWVFEPTTELPVVTIWGNAFLRRPNTFNPVQPPQVWSGPNVQNSGIGGLQAGTIELEPLLYEGS